MADFLSPKTGPGLRSPTSPGTGPDQHGRIVNPPRMAALGGLDKTHKASGHFRNAMKIVKPGGGAK